MSSVFIKMMKNNFPGIFHPLEEKKSDSVVKAEDSEEKKEDTIQLARVSKTVSGLKCTNVGCTGVSQDTQIIRYSVSQKHVSLGLTKIECSTSI